MNALRLILKASSDPERSTSKPLEFDPSQSVKKGESFDLGHGSEVFHVPRFFPADQSWAWFDYINKHVPWSRPTLLIFGRRLVQPRDSCYIAAEGLPAISYNGHTPRAYSWDDFPPLKDILDAVHKALPGSRFNSLVLNRYDGNNDYVSWHSDDEVLYGPTPEIASVTFGCEREFLLRKKPSKMSRASDDEPKSKRLRKSHDPDQHSFVLKHGSLLVMRGYTQRDWLHSVPKRAKPMSIRINLTFSQQVLRNQLSMATASICVKVRRKWNQSSMCL